MPHWLAVLFVILGVGFGGLVAYRLVTGRSLGLIGFFKGQVYTIRNDFLEILDSGNVKDSGTDEFSNIVFLHHSTGTNLIEQGNVRAILAARGYQFWDHGYNEAGLRGPDGLRRDYNYQIPDDNTNPGGLYQILAQAEYSLPLNAFSGLLQHDVIVLKSCFRPANNIRSDAQLEQYKTWYLEMRSEMDAHPDKIFIIITTPPLNPAETNPAEAARAREFANWLKSDDFLVGHPNIFTFDFFNSLAESDPDSPNYNMLRSAYSDGDDSHPNQLANEILGPDLADFIDESIQSYQAAP